MTIAGALIVFNLSVIEKLYPAFIPALIPSMFAVFIPSSLTNSRTSLFFSNISSGNVYGRIMSKNSPNPS